MRWLIKQIPNTITSLNVLAGCIAIVAALYGEYLFSAQLILLAAVFDFLDGLSARLLNAYSPMGLQLDSLADIVSFGVAPSMIVFSFLSQNIGIYWALSAFLITIFSALRLAKFNIDDRQSDSFFGLATPANALFWAFLIVSITGNFPLLSDERILSGKLISTILIPLFCFLMLSNIPMFSLKIKSFKIGEIKWQLIFLLISLCLLIYFKFNAFPIIILVYIIFSLIIWIYSLINDK